MRRLSVLLALLLALTVLSGGVLAAETAYFFEALPSVSTLPVFETVSGVETMMAYDGYLPVGKYAVAFYQISSSVEIVILDTVTVHYSESSDEGYLGFQMDCTVDFLDTLRPCTLSCVYVVDEDITYLGLAFDSDGAVFYEDWICVFVPIPADTDSEDSSDGSTVLKDIIVDLFGPYEQQTETITETLADGSTVTTEQLVPGVAGLDYPWIASVVLFALVLLSFFRLLGGLIKQ